MEKITSLEAHRIKIISLLILIFISLITISSAKTYIINQDIPVVISPRLDNAPTTNALCNLTLTYNGTLLIPYTPMTFNSSTQTANYTIPASNITSIGDYNLVTTCNSGTNWGTSEGILKVSKNGLDVSDSTPIFYISFLILSIGMLAFCIYGYLKINGEDSYNEYNEIIQINWKKYAKKLLLVLCFISFEWVMLNAWTISYGFLEIGIMTQWLFFLWYYPLSNTLYIFMLWGVYILWRLFVDIKKMFEIERFGSS